MASVFDPRLFAVAIAIVNAWALAGCVQDVAVGSRAAELVDGGGSNSGGTGANNGSEDAGTSEDAGVTDGGTTGGDRGDAGMITCTPADCDASLLAVPACPQGQTQECVPENGGCRLACRPALGPVCGNTRCAPDEVCDAPVGTCDPKAAGARCVQKPGVCILAAPDGAVCSCSGQTFASRCEALSAGALLSLEQECVAVSFAECDATKCAGPAPGVASMVCPDGTTSGAACARTSNGCNWVVRQCPSEEPCAQPTRASIAAGECWIDSDCLSPKKCLGANVCPCDAKCLVANTPGKCM